MKFPDLDTDGAGYRAGIVQGQADGGFNAVLPGRHHSFSAAKARAERVARALIAAGESGMRGRVTAEGDRPSGFPRNGVIL